MCLRSSRARRGARIVEACCPRSDSGRRSGSLPLLRRVASRSINDPRPYELPNCLHGDAAGLSHTHPADLAPVRQLVRLAAPDPKSLGRFDWPIEQGLHLRNSRMTLSSQLPNCLHGHAANPSQPHPGISQRLVSSCTLPGLTGLTRRTSAASAGRNSKGSTRGRHSPDPALRPCGPGRHMSRSFDASNVRVQRQRSDPRSFSCRRGPRQHSMPAGYGALTCRRIVLVTQERTRATLSPATAPAGGGPPRGRETTVWRHSGVEGKGWVASRPGALPQGRSADISVPMLDQSFGLPAPLCRSVAPLADCRTEWRLSAVAGVPPDGTPPARRRASCERARQRITVARCCERKRISAPCSAQGPRSGTIR